MIGPAHADQFDAWVPKVSNIGPGKTSFFVAEDTQANNVSTRTASSSRDSWWCSDFTVVNAPSCDLENKRAGFEAYAVLPYCSAALQQDCVEALEVTIPGKESVKATYVRNIAGITFKPLSSIGLYEASTISIWSAPGAPSAGGLTDYAVNVRTRLNYNPQKKVFETTGMTSIVMPFRLVNDSRYQLPSAGTIKNAKGGENLGVAIYGLAHECIFNEAGVCGIMQNFTDGTVVKLTSRISKQVGGWFKGRLQSPKIEVSSFSATNNTVSVEARAVSVARLQTDVSKESAPEDINDLFFKSGVMGDLWSGQGALTNSQGDMAFRYLEAFRTIAQETSAAVSTLWSFGTVGAGEGSACLGDTSKVLGIVTTNSTVYEGSAPTFEGGQINYQVGGLHYLPGGKQPVSGTYDLVMRSETARCLYGFTKAPISASIRVVNSDGETSTAVTSFIEKSGWVHFSANGFHFSTPQINVKLTQPKTKTITCLKANKPSVKKTVTAIKPTCPVGYRLKK